MERGAAELRCAQVVRRITRIDVQEWRHILIFIMLPFMSMVVMGCYPHRGRRVNLSVEELTAQQAAACERRDERAARTFGEELARRSGSSLPAGSPCAQSQVAPHDVGGADYDLNVTPYERADEPADDADRDTDDAFFSL